MVTVVNDNTGKLYASADHKNLAGCPGTYANSESLRAEHGRAVGQQIDEKYFRAIIIAAYESLYLQCVNTQYGT